MSAADDIDDSVEQAVLRLLDMLATRPTQIEIERVVRLAYVRGMTAGLEYARRAAADRSDVR